MDIITGALLIVLGILVLLLLVLIFTLVMLIDNVKRRFPAESDQVVWLVLQFVFQVITAIVYYFVVYRTPRTDLAGPVRSVAIVLSIFAGVGGVDRFYIGHNWLGVLKLITIGGLGVWWLVDVILLLTDSVKPKKGEWVTY